MTYPPPPPIPIAPLPYSPPRPVRPGLLTAVGVISLVLGGVGILASAGGVARALMYGVLSKMSTMSATVVASRSFGPTRFTAPPLSISADARTTTNALATLEPLTFDQKDQVVGLLAQQGDWVLGTPQAGADWTADDARRMVRGHGKVTATTDAGGGDAFYFQTDDGRLEVHDHFALFHPKGGPLLTSSVKRDPSGQLIKAPETEAATDAAGNPTTAPSPAGASPAPVVMPPFKFTVARGAVRLSVVAEALCLVVAIWLVVAGAQLLRDKPSGRTLHLWWAALKIPIIVLTGIASAWLTASTISSLAVASPANPAVRMNTAVTYIGITSAVVFAGLQLIYPVAVLVVMNTPTAKQWFATEGSVNA